MSEEVERGSKEVELGSAAVERGSAAVERGSAAVERGSAAVELGSAAVELGSVEVERGTHIQLALAVAAGIAITKWARQNNVPLRTAYRWSKDRDFRKHVEQARRKWIDRAVGKMTRRFPTTVDKLNKLADTTTSDSVKLRRAVSCRHDVGLAILGSGSADDGDRGDA